MRMTTGEKLKLVMSRKGITITDLSKASGQSRQNLSNKFSRDNFTEQDAVALFAALGLEYDTIVKDPATGEVII